MGELGEGLLTSGLHLLVASTGSWPELSLVSRLPSACIRAQALHVTETQAPRHANTRRSPERWHAVPSLKSCLLY